MSPGRIDTAIAALLAAGAPFKSADVVAASGASRQAVARHLRRLVDENRLTATGKGRATRYTPAGPVFAFEATMPILGLAEDRLWQQIRGRVPELSNPVHAPALALTTYAFTEMVNNAIDHAGAETLTVRLWFTAGDLHFEVADDGVGVFENIRQKVGLPDHLSALQDVSKGKLTTQPDRHSGEGLFFTSKVADRFEVAANGLAWLVDNRRDDVAIRQDAKAARGTRVHFEVSLAKTLSLEAVFARYTHDFVFDTSKTVVKLFAYGVQFVSRSEAKRLLNGLDRFAHVILDFTGVEGIGQGFADEVFRVWARAHPRVEIIAENMVPPVAFMVNRAQAPAKKAGPARKAASKKPAKTARKSAARPVRKPAKAVKRR